MSVVEVRGLRYRYADGTQAIDGVDFHLEAGECVALFGANGSGKTTFVLHLNGLLSGEGSIEICGVPLKPETLPQIRGKLGLVFQDSDEQLFMPTVLEDVAFGPVNQGVSSEDALHRAAHALEDVGGGGWASAIHKAPYHWSEQRRKTACGPRRSPGDAA